MVGWPLGVCCGVGMCIGLSVGYLLGWVGCWGVGLRILVVGWLGCAVGSGVDVVILEKTLQAIGIVLSCSFFVFVVGCFHVWFLFLFCVFSSQLKIQSKKIKIKMMTQKFENLTFCEQYTAPRTCHTRNFFSFVCSRSHETEVFVLTHLLRVWS